MDQEEPFESEFYFQPNYIEIPEVFHSDLTGAPFTSCIECECELYHSDTPYLIEKAFKNHNKGSIQSTVFEYAICPTCHATLQGSMSEETKINLGLFFQKNVDLATRSRELTNEFPLDIEKWLERCILTGKHKQEVSEFQIYAQCQGEHLIFSEMPFMISGDGIEQFLPLVSNKTMDDLDDFGQKVMGPSPEIEELLQPRKTVPIF